MKYEELSDDFKAKVDACRTSEDIFRLVKEEGIDLTQEQLDMIAGGGDKGLWSKNPCPKCGSYCTGLDMTRGFNEGKPTPFQCFDCGYAYMDTLG